MATQVEIESKFDVDEAFALPDLLRLPGVASVEDPQEHALEATYFDTPDLRLLRSRITLRRRTGGPDAGWHPKPPAGGGARLEVRRPLGRATRTVPAQILGLVRVRVRGVRPEPVALLSTRRVVHHLLDADGAMLAEVADDVVVATSLGHEGGPATSTTWREVEVELGTGDRGLLAAADALLREAGARPASSASKVGRALAARLDPPAEAAEPEKGKGKGKGKGRGKAKGSKAKGEPAVPTVGEACLAYLASQVEELQAWDPHVRVDTDDSVHKMRVATRRLRSALATDRRVLDGAATDPLRAELRWLGGVLGGARDAEVLAARLDEAVHDLPDDAVLGPVAARVTGELAARYRDAHAAVLVELDGERYLALVVALEALLEDPPFTPAADRPAPKALRHLVGRTRRRVERAVAALEEAPDDAAHDALLHEVRKAAKRARYAGEAAAPYLPAKHVERATAFAAAMEAVQEALGEHQDTVVAREELRAMAVRAHLAGENGFTYGVLHGRQEALAEGCEDAFAAAWADAGSLRWP